MLVQDLSHDRRFAQEGVRDLAARGEDCVRPGDILAVAYTCCKCPLSPLPLQPFASPEGASSNSASLILLLTDLVTWAICTAGAGVAEEGRGGVHVCYGRIERIATFITKSARRTKLVPVSAGRWADDAFQFFLKWFEAVSDQAKQPSDFVRHVDGRRKFTLPMRAQQGHNYMVTSGKNAVCSAWKPSKIMLSF